ncbi:MAG TPA: hypothetical protein VF092_12355 [Longimicrobium sp.]
MTEFEGLRFIVDLFESERQIPQLAVCSFLSRRALVALGDERGEAARLIFPFVRLPVPPAALAEAASSAEPVSQMVHVWLRDHVLSARPFLMWEHNFRRDTSGDPAGLRRALDRLAAKVRARRPALARTFQDLSTFEQWISDAQQAVQNGDLRAAEELGARIQERLRRVHREAEEDKERDKAAPYAVVVVEDDAAQRRQIVQGLERYFTEVQGFEEGRSALAELRNRDAAGRRFSGVVSDWDLREQGETDGFMQPLQGPDVLLHAAALCTGPLVGLTSLPSDIVAAILNAAPEDARARLSWYPKHEPGDLGVQNYRGLAHHITTKIQEALGFQDETPAQLGFAPWRKHGLGEHYVTVRMWSEARQQAFFSECFTRARESLDAYETGGQRQDVSEPPFSLALNVPSGTRAEPYTFARFQDVLCGRLVVLTLYGRQLRPERSYWTVLARLFPQMMEKARSNAIRKGDRGADPYPSSFPSIMSVLGLPRSGPRIDLGKLRLMPHEVRWLDEQALDLGLPPLLTADEEGEASELVESIEDILARLREQVPPAVLDAATEDVHDDDPAGGALSVALGEEAVATVEAAARALAELGRHDEVRPDTVRAAASLLKHELEFFIDDGVFEKLYRKLPSWRTRLNDVINRLSA